MTWSKVRAGQNWSNTTTFDQLFWSKQLQNRIQNNPQNNLNNNPQNNLQKQPSNNPKQPQKQPSKQPQNKAPTVCIFIFYYLIIKYLLTLVITLEL